jgi:methylenetetrahydrofolate dehydrogenase (NADP+)/methenyltetrahydrofolate cyclohydrolase
MSEAGIAEIAEIIDGKAFAAGLRARIGEAAEELQAKHGLIPGLAVVLVGENPASQVYVRNKAKQTREAGMASFEHKLAVDTRQDELLDLIRQLNDDPAVHGILVQRCSTPSRRPRTWTASTSSTPGVS